MSKEASPERLIKDVLRVLNAPFWISDLEADEIYERLHDDDDGTGLGKLMVQFDREGDAHVTIDSNPNLSLRYRTGFGGGKSFRTRNALMILALAMKLDSEERPDS